MSDSIIAGSGSAFAQAREQRHAFVAELGIYAIRSDSIDDVFERAIEGLRTAFEVEAAAIFEQSAQTGALLLRAGAGWRPGSIGFASIAVDPAYFEPTASESSDDPTGVVDFNSDARFRPPPLLREHGIVSGVSVAIRGSDAPFGVLGVYSRVPRAFARGDVAFLSSVANVLSAAIGRLAIDSALRESEVRFRTMADSAPVLLWMSGESKRCTFVNKQWMEFTGRTLDANLGDSWIEGIHPDDLRRCSEAYETAFDRRESFKLEYRRRRADGSYRWILDHGMPRLDPSGRFLGYVGSCVDITEQRDSQTALRDSQARLSAIFSSAMDAIISVDVQQRIVLFNHSAEQMFQCPATEAIGSTLDRFIPERFRSGHREHVRRFGEQGETSRRMGALGELRALRSNGEEFPIEASISSGVSGEQRIMTVILRDVSERTRLEQQLLQAQRLESVGRLAGGIAHDFNNLLTAIFGCVEIARSAVPVDHLARTAIDLIQRSAERGGSLTQKLLAFARKQVIQPRVVNLNDQIHETTSLLARVLGEDVQLVVRAAPQLSNVRIDPDHFGQVIMNLAVNARDAMPDGGKFFLETENVVLDDSFGEGNPEFKPGPHVLFSASDTGCGMDEETRRNCFEPFFTTKERGKGTGLGLATCLGIVQQNGGHILVYSEQNHGTCFKIYLPACDEQATQTPAATNAKSEHGTETILLVEDEAIVRDVATTYLRARGYNVLPAPNPAEALRIAEEHRGVIQLLLTDVVMPGMSGRQLAQQLRTTRPETRVLFVSGYTDSVIVHHGMLDAGTEFLAKPYMPARLAERVREVLDVASPAKSQTEAK